MARVTVEDCLARIPNRFALTILASRRARALSEGRGHALIECENKEGVAALREISADKVRFKEDVDATMIDFIEEQRRQLRVTTGEHTFLEAASLRALEDEDEEGTEDEDDVEELHSDPEALNKQAKKTEDSDEDEEESDDEEPAAEEEESSDEDDVPAGDDELETAFDDEEIGDDDSDSDDDEEEDKEEEKG